MESSIFNIALIIFAYVTGLLSASVYRNHKYKVWHWMRIFRRYEGYSIYQKEFKYLTLSYGNAGYERNTAHRIPGGFHFIVRGKELYIEWGIPKQS